MRNPGFKAGRQKGQPPTCGKCGAKGHQSVMDGHGVLSCSPTFLADQHMHATGCSYTDAAQLFGVLPGTIAQRRYRIRLRSKT